MTIQPEKQCKYFLAIISAIIEANLKLATSPISGTRAGSWCSHFPKPRGRFAIVAAEPCFGRTPSPVIRLKCRYRVFGISVRRFLACDGSLIETIGNGSWPVGLSDVISEMNYVYC